MVLRANYFFEIITEVPLLTIDKIKKLCTNSVYKRAGRYGVGRSDLISTTAELDRNTIKGEIKRAYIHDELIFRDIDVPNSSSKLQTIRVYCECKYYCNETCCSGYCCSHIIGQTKKGDIFKR